MSDRNASLLMGLSKSDPIVEVGPSFNPIAAKRDGWNTTIVDHANAGLDHRSGHLGHAATCWR